jgi:hypothetical protein
MSTLESSQSGPGATGRVLASSPHNRVLRLLSVRSLVAQSVQLRTKATPRGPAYGLTCQNQHEHMEPRVWSSLPLLLTTGSNIGLNSGRVRSLLKNRHRVKYRTRLVPVSDTPCLPETSTFNTFRNTLVSMCQHNSVSLLVHMC